MPSLFRAFALTAVLTIGGAATEAAAGGGGHGGAGWHAGGWHGFVHRGRFMGRGNFANGYYGGYGDYAAVDDQTANVVDITPVMVGPPQPTEPLVPPTLGMTCQHSVQTVTVPSEGGGDRQIRITRC